MKLVEAILAAYAGNAPLVAATPGGMVFETSDPGTAKPRIVFHLPDDGVADLRGYSIPGTVRTLTRAYQFLFTVYADSWDSLRSILALLCSDTGPFEGVTFTLDAPEISGGSRFLENGRRLFRNQTKRNELDAGYEYVAEVPYETLVNNPQG